MIFFSFIAVFFIYGCYNAFDSVAWSFIYKVLYYLNFNKAIIQWIEIFNKNIKSAISQNGHLSNVLSIHRSCRQGDPISSYFFILCAEILVIIVKNNDSIKGISLESVEQNISQFADDTTFILDGS